MSYLHCPSCKRAYNIAVDRACPVCPVPATLVDPAEDIVAATEQLARAMARATPDERQDAMGRMDRLALPAPGAKPVTFHGAMIRSIREALDPVAPTPQPRTPWYASRGQPLFAMVATRMLEKLAPHVERYAPRARELSTGLRARMRALTA
jgi:hypothetical protein